MDLDRVHSVSRAPTVIRLLGAAFTLTLIVSGSIPARADGLPLQLPTNFVQSLLPVPTPTPTAPSGTSDVANPTALPSSVGDVTGVLNGTGSGIVPGTDGNGDGSGAGSGGGSSAGTPPADDIFGTGPATHRPSGGTHPSTTGTHGTARTGSTPVRLPGSSSGSGFQGRSTLSRAIRPFAANAAALARPLSMPIALGILAIVVAFIATRKPGKLKREGDGAWSNDGDVWRL